MIPHRANFPVSVRPSVCPPPSLEDGLLGLKKSLSDPQSGLSDPKSGLPKLNLDLSVPRSGLSDPKSGFSVLSDPNLALSDPFQTQNQAFKTSN